MADVERKVGRPITNQLSRAIREFRPEERAPIGGFSDVLTLRTRDEDYHYRWVLDENEEGRRIMRFVQAGYEFAPAEGHEVGQLNVYKSRNNDVGSICRVPSGNRWLYLMRIRRDWHEEDIAKKHERVRKTEETLTRKRDSERDDGNYGSVKIER